MQKLKGIILCIAICMVTVICIANFKPSAVSADTSNLNNLQTESQDLTEKLNKNQNNDDIRLLYKNLAEYAISNFFTESLSDTKLAKEFWTLYEKAILININDMSQQKSLYNHMEKMIGLQTVYSKTIEEYLEKIYERPIELNGIQNEDLLGRNTLWYLRELGVKSLPLKKIILEKPEELLRQFSNFYDVKTLKDAINCIIEGLKSGKNSVVLRVDAMAKDFSNIIVCPSTKTFDLTDFIHSEFNRNYPEEYLNNLIEAMELYPKKDDRYAYIGFYCNPIYQVNNKFCEEEVNCKSREIVESLNILGKGKSEFEKVKAIYTYIVDNIKYDEEHKKYSIYDAFINKNVVCSGLSLAFRKLCAEVGIQSLCISAMVIGENTIGHVYNMVKIYDKWYVIDCTNKFFLSDMVTCSAFMPPEHSKGEYGSHFRKIFPAAGLTLNGMAKFYLPTIIKYAFEKDNKFKEKLKIILEKIERLKDIDEMIGIQARPFSYDVPRFIYIHRISRYGTKTESKEFIVKVLKELEQILLSLKDNRLPKNQKELKLLIDEIKELGVDITKLDNSMIKGN